MCVVVANAMSALNSTRVLLFLTTSGSSNHFSKLLCTKKHMATNQRLQLADVLVHSNRYLGKDFRARVQDAFPNKNTTIVVKESKAQDQQQQTIEMIVYASSMGWFLQYRWVIHHHLDVIVNNDTILFNMMDHPSRDAVLANCLPDVHCVRSCKKAVVHSDFFAFRPAAVSFPRATRVKHAETFATELFSNTIASGRDSWIQKRGFNDRSCRIRAGVRTGLKHIYHNHVKDC